MPAVGAARRHGRSALWFNCLREHPLLSRDGVVAKRIAAVLFWLRRLGLELPPLKAQH